MAVGAEEQKLAQPQPAVDSQLQAWYMDDSKEDQRSTHKCKPNRPASIEQLRKLGVLSWKLDADKHETDPKLKAIRAVRNYSYQDVITIRPDTLPNYEQKLKSFFEEHLHTDEEIRYILEGGGYFDVRDADEQWIRVALDKGDMIVLPEGIYHRFTLDDTNYVKAMRLFVGEPVWTPYNRPQDDMPSRKKYVENFLSSLDTAKPDVKAENSNKGVKNTTAAKQEAELIDDGSTDLKRKQEGAETNASKHRKLHRTCDLSQPDELAYKGNLSRESSKQRRLNVASCAAYLDCMSYAAFSVLS